MDGNNQTELYRAVREGSPSYVERLLKEGMDPNHVDKNMNTPVHHAIKNRRWLQLVKLLEHGGDLSRRNKLYFGYELMMRKLKYAYYGTDMPEILMGYLDGYLEGLSLEDLHKLPLFRKHTLNCEVGERWVDIQVRKYGHLYRNDQKDVKFLFGWSTGYGDGGWYSVGIWDDDHRKHVIDSICGFRFVYGRPANPLMRKTTACLMKPDSRKNNNRDAMKAYWCMYYGAARQARVDAVMGVLLVVYRVKWMPEHLRRLMIGYLV